MVKPPQLQIIDTRLKIGYCPYVGLLDRTPRVEQCWFTQHRAHNLCNDLGPANEAVRIWLRWAQSITLLETPFGFRFSFHAFAQCDGSSKPSVLLATIYTYIYKYINVKVFKIKIYTIYTKVWFKHGTNKLFKTKWFQTCNSSHVFLENPNFQRAKKCRKHQEHHFFLFGSEQHHFTRRFSQQSQSTKTWFWYFVCCFLLNQN